MDPRAFIDEYLGLKVEYSDEFNRGIITTKPIRKSNFVCEYAGITQLMNNYSIFRLSNSRMPPLEPRNVNKVSIFINRQNVTLEA